MARSWQGVQSEVLLSLALVMATATVLLAAIFLEVNQARVERLHGLLGRGLIAETTSPRFLLHPWEGGSWWRIDSAGGVSGLNASVGALDRVTRRLAGEVARTGRARVESGAPWSPIRFAAPDPEGRGAVAGRIEAPVSGLVLGALVLFDVLVFLLFGLFLLRRRVVGPLARLAAAVRELGDGEIPSDVPVEGADEIAELGSAFNEMQSALQLRTGALEKAVAELRSTNADLVQAREGLDRAERLALVGTLAAGVAHEVGNPMGALLAFLEIASRDPGLGEEGRSALERASGQGERVRVILRQLLDFSRPPRIERVPISLEEIAEQVVQLVAAQRRWEDIALEIVCVEDVPRARGDASLASQVLLNLVLNAAAAVEKASSKRIRIEIRSAASRLRSDEVGQETGAGRLRRAGPDSVICLV
ncbi:MAG TPA: HAMP domain-containing protein, partial [Myxococcota bacterium]|nr:HAMP domain-containing protein [Myxococcota bacterium]